MASKYDEMMLLAYIEDELDASGRAVVEEWMSRDAHLGRLVRAMMADRNMLRDAVDPMPPQWVMEEVDRQLERAMLVDSVPMDTQAVVVRQQWVVRRVTAIAAIAAMVLIVVGVVTSSLWNTGRAPELALLLSGERGTPDGASPTTPSTPNPATPNPPPAATADANPASPTSAVTATSPVEPTAASNTAMTTGTTGTTGTAATASAPAAQTPSTATSVEPPAIAAAPTAFSAQSSPTPTPASATAAPSAASMPSVADAPPSDATIKAPRMAIEPHAILSDVGLDQTELLLSGPQAEVYGGPEILAELKGLQADPSRAQRSQIRLVTRNVPGTRDKVLSMLPAKTPMDFLTPARPGQPPSIKIAVPVARLQQVLALLKRDDAMVGIAFERSVVIAAGALPQPAADSAQPKSPGTLPPPTAPITPVTPWPSLKPDYASLLRQQIALPPSARSSSQPSTAAAATASPALTIPVIIEPAPQSDVPPAVTPPSSEPSSTRDQ
jgi:hypothetical protein